MKFAIFGLLLTIIGFPAHADRAYPDTIAFVGVNVIPMDGNRLLMDQTVLVSHGRIAAIGARSAISVPRKATRIDGAGHYLLPALADMHTHLLGVIAGRADTDEIMRSELLLYLATGVTLVRNMSGTSEVLEYKRRVANSELLGPRIITASPILDGPDATWSFALKLSDPAEVPALVHRMVAEGYDQLKVYNNLPKDVYEALSDAGSRDGIRVVGHVPFAVGIDGALAAHQYSIEHQRGYDFDGVDPKVLLVNGGRNAERFGSWQHMSDARMRELVEHTVAAGTWNCPTLVVDDFISNPVARKAAMADPRMRYVHPAVRDAVLNSAYDKLFPADALAAIRAAFPVRHRMLKMLNDANGGLLVGTDTPVPYLIAGFTPIDEMQHFVEAGLTTYDALRAATVEPAKFLGLDADSGTVGAGKRADLILVDANPLDDIGNLWQLSGVVVNGRWISHAELHRLMEEMAMTYRR